MGVALIAWGRFFDENGNRITVPAPSTTPGARWLWDYVAEEALALRQVGFSAVQLPPVGKAQGGAGGGCDGYGLFDPRDIGSKAQQGSTSTRYGSAESLRRLVANCHAAGLDVYLDVVLHQLSGENGGPGVFKYLGADGKTLNGRGALHAGCFRGVPPANRPDDAVPAPSDDYEFGREKVYQNCQPAGYTTSDALDYGDWLFRTTDADGMRFDDAKGTWAPFVGEFMRSRAMGGKFAYSEFFDGNPDTIDWWALGAPMSSRSLVEDFTLHWALQTACDGGNAAALDNAGYLARNPYMSCTFVDNPDTDTTPGQSIIGSKLLAYAFILSAEGYPFVYGKDYFTGAVWPGAYGLKPWIDNLIWVHERLAAGSTITRYVDGKVIVLNRLGEPGLLTALNFDQWNQRAITCLTGFGPNAPLHDYTGRHPDIWTDGQGQASFTIPANAYGNGQSYLCFSRAGQGGGIEITPRTTTQTFFGAEDLDTPPASDGRVKVGRVWCAGGSAIQAHLAPVGVGPSWPPQAVIALEILNPTGAVAGMHSWTKKDPFPAGGLQLHGSEEGWYSLELVSSNLPPGGVAFELAVTYTGTAGLPA